MNEKLKQAVKTVKDIDNIMDYSVEEKVDAVKLVVKESLKGNSQIKACDLERRYLLKAMNWLLFEYDVLDRAYSKATAEKVRLEDSYNCIVRTLQQEGSNT